MCGIVGVLNYSKTNAIITDDMITLMRDTMVHRGPDDAGIYIGPDKKVGLGHRRLSIIDLSPAGHQPMCNEDKAIWITYNGEIYNHLDLRAQLERKGHRYRSRTDTETIIHAYEEWGIECISKLDGMFAFALWDSKKEILYLVRDRIGVKPVFYTQIYGQFIFASEIKAILQYPSIPKELNRKAFYHYLTFLTTPCSDTLFSGISKLEPGHFIRVNREGVAKVRYWDIADYILREENNGTELDWIEHSRILVQKAVGKRMMSDVPFGVFLSGGVDSSTNVALMSQLTGLSVNTFSIAYEGDRKHNELGYAQTVARLFRTNHREIVVDAREFEETFTLLASTLDLPMSDPNTPLMYILSQHTKSSGVTVVQVGEGGDEVFCGYSSYLRILNDYKYIWQHYDRLPGYMKKIISKMSLLAPIKRNSLAEMFIRAGTPFTVPWRGIHGYGEVKKRQLLADRDLDPEDNSYDVFRSYCEQIHFPSVDNFLKKMLLLEFRLRLPELILPRVDNPTMAASVEARVPFLDPEVILYGLSLPRAVKMKDGEMKYILKKSMEPLLPKEILYRPKIGFGMMLMDFFKSGFIRSALHELISSKMYNDLFNMNTVKKIAHDHMVGRRDSSFQVWTLVAFMMWHRRWLYES